MQRAFKGFKNRAAAGRQLAGALEHYRHRDDVVVLALPRGGVPVAAEIAQHLDAPLDVFLVRKLGVPGHEELAMGAIAEGEHRFVNRQVADRLRIPNEAITRSTLVETGEMRRCAQKYRGQREMTPVRDRVVVIVDDGLAERPGGGRASGHFRGGALDEAVGQLGALVVPVAHVAVDLVDAASADGVVGLVL